MRNKLKELISAEKFFPSEKDNLLEILTSDIAIDALEQHPVEESLPEFRAARLEKSLSLGYYHIFLGNEQHPFYLREALRTANALYVESGGKDVTQDHYLGYIRKALFGLEHAKKIHDIFKELKKYYDNPLQK